MKTLKKELRPDWATAERLYPLILKRLEQYETFWDAQPKNTPEYVNKNTSNRNQNYSSARILQRLCSVVEKILVHFSVVFQLRDEVFLPKN